MIGVFVTFQYGDDFNADAVRNIADAARTKFEGLNGLRSKAFTINAAKHQATNVYLWESEIAARSFFTDDLIARVTELYGVSPTLEFVDVAALVDNASTEA